jgi:uncharacterized protein YodC (DUF2158 family)
MKHDKFSQENQNSKKFQIGDVVHLKTDGNLKLSVSEYESDDSPYLFVHYVSKAGMIESKRVHENELEKAVS